MDGSRGVSSLSLLAGQTDLLTWPIYMDGPLCLQTCITDRGKQTWTVLGSFTFCTIWCNASVCLRCNSSALTPKIGFWIRRARPPYRNSSSSDIGLVCYYAVVNGGLMAEKADLERKWRNKSEGLLVCAHVWVQVCISMSTAMCCSAVRDSGMARRIKHCPWVIADICRHVHKCATPCVTSTNDVGEGKFNDTISRVGGRSHENNQIYRITASSRINRASDVIYGPPPPPFFPYLSPCGSGWVEIKCWQSNREVSIVLPWMDPVNLSIVRSKASLPCHLETLGDEIRSQTPTLTGLSLTCQTECIYIQHNNTCIIRKGWYPLRDDAWVLQGLLRRGLDCSLWNLRIWVKTIKLK